MKKIFLAIPDFAVILTAIVFSFLFFYLIIERFYDGSFIRTDGLLIILILTVFAFRKLVTAILSLSGIVLYMISLSIVLTGESWLSILFGIVC
jgi:hypothetical protein